MKGDSSIVDLLLELKIEINELDKDQYSPLGTALREEKFKIARKILMHEDVEVKNGGGPFSSLMHLAVAKLEVICVEKLIEKGALINAKDANSGDTPLHLLINVFSKNAINAKNILLMLTSNGVEVNARNNDLWTPLHLAVKRGSYDAVDALLS